MALQVLLVTGHSGSGKSTALRALEDAGYFCVDNLPARMALDLVSLMERDEEVEQLALGTDIRDHAFVAQVPAVVARLRGRGLTVQLLFLTADEGTMIRRFATTRRLHPLDQGRGLRAALADEAAALSALRELADDTWDTSAMTPHVLRAQVEAHFGQQADLRLHARVLSFGFKYGVPAESNLVFDVRFLPNPYFDPALRPLSGTDPAVAQAVLALPEAQSLLAQVQSLLAFLLPLMQREGKRRVYVAIGCTGGRHRSVALACELAAALARDGGVVASAHHRDIGREPG